MKKSSNNFQGFIKKNFVWILFVGILILAAFFRFYQLSSLPPGLHPDEAANGLDIFRILENRDWRIIYNTNGPREALFFYLQAVFVATLGNTILALRMAPALFGVVSVAVIFFATKEWFSRRTALVTAFFFAISPWVVIIQRDGFRASLVPLFIGLVMWFGAKAYKTNKLVYYILAGVALGLGFYTYTAFAMIMVAVFAGLMYMLLVRRKWLKDNWKKVLISAGVFALVLTPLVVATAKDPSGSAARAGGTSFLNKDLNKGQPVQTFLSGTAKTILQYNYFGDENSRHNVPGQPLLNTFAGLMLVLGLVICLYHIKRPRYAILLIVLASMLMPVVLTAEGLPHGLRSIGTAVPIFMLVGLGTNYMLYIWYRTFPVNKLARVSGLAIICILMGLSLIQAYRAYFVAWAQDNKTYEAYSETAVAIAKYLNSNNSNNRTNFVVMGGYEANPTQYLTHNKSTYKLLDESGLRDLPISGGPKLIIIPAGVNHDQLVELAKIKFPDGTLTNITSDFSGRLLFSVYEVKQ